MQKWPALKLSFPDFSLPGLVLSALERALASPRELVNVQILIQQVGVGPDSTCPELPAEVEVISHFEY